MRSLKNLKNKFALVFHGKSLSDKFFLLILSFLSVGNFFYRMLVGHNFSILEKVRLNVVVNKNGILYLIHNINNYHCLSDETQQKEVQFIKRLKLKEILLDVGAYIGTHSLELSSLKDVKKIYSFEPIEENFSLLQKNIELNNKNNKVIPIKKVVFSKSLNSIRIYKTSTSGTNSSIFKKGDLFEEVDAVSIDDFLASEKIPPKKISLLKIDVEGAEKDVLLGASNLLTKSSPIVIFEAWNKEKLDENIKILNSFGYFFFYKINPITFMALKNNKEVVPKDLDLVFIDSNHLGNIHL